MHARSARLAHNDWPTGDTSTRLHKLRAACVASGRMATGEAPIIPLLELPEAILSQVFAGLDCLSRIALSLTCTPSNTPALLSFFEALTVDCNVHTNPDEQGPKLRWPKHAPTLKKLIILGYVMGPRPAQELGRFLEDVQDDSELLQSVTSLVLKGWVLGAPGMSSTHLLKLLGRCFPSLIHLKLDRCTAFEHLVSGAPARLKQLGHLEVHNAQPDFLTNTAPTVLPAGLGALTALTNLGLVTPHTYQRSIDISPLAALVQLRRLELALPVLKLTGLGAIGQACSQLTQLMFVFSSRGGPGLEISAPGEVVAWPHLVEAHVLAPSDLLLQLGLHTEATASSLQRLRMHCLCSHGGGQTRDATARGREALAACGAVENPLVVYGMTDLPRTLKMLHPMMGGLFHLALCDDGLRATDTPARLLVPLRELPHLQCLTLGAMDPKSSVWLAPLLLAQQQLTRVIIGIRALHTGYDRWAPSQAESLVWCGMLATLLAHTEDSSAGGAGSSAGDSCEPMLPAFTAMALAVTDEPSPAFEAAAAAFAAPESAIMQAARAAVSAPASPSPEALTPTSSTTSSSPAAGAALRSPAAATSAPAAVPVHIYFGAWWPASRINHELVKLNPHYQQLRQLADQPSSAAPGRFRLHECDGGSASDMALGADEPWLEPHFKRSIQLWDNHGPHRWEEEGQEFMNPADYNCCGEGDHYVCDEITRLGVR